MYRTLLRAAAWCAVSTACLAPHARGEFLLSESSEQAMRLHANGAIPRSRSAELRPGVLARLQGGGEAALTLNLFADARFQLRVERSRRLGPERQAWSGRLVGIPDSRVTMVLSDGTLAAAVHAADRGTFEIRPTEPGAYVVREIGSHALTRCGGVPNAQAAGTAQAALTGGGVVNSMFVPPAPTCDDGSRIDLLVVYTQDAMAAAGGVAQIHTLIDLAVADMNDALGISGIDTSVHLVHRQQVAYVESGVGQIDATRLFTAGDGYLDDVPPLRDRYGADCVCLWVNNLDSGGIGYYPDATLTGINASGISVMRQDNAAGLTLAHEIGHNLWCAHDRENDPGPPPFAAYSHGYREPGGQWRTIMAYPPGFMIPYFANPDVIYPGPINPGPTGIPDGQPAACDIALTINQTRLIVANFRATAVTGLSSVLHVDASASPGGDGSSWAGAINDLQRAICVAGGSNGTVQEIWVAAGTYKPDAGSGDRLSTFALVSGIALYGGFAGTETLLSQRDVEANVTVLSGDIGEPGVESDNCYHVVTGSLTDSSAVLDGFTITAGRADGPGWPNSSGGGMFVEQGAPTLANCTFEGNYAADGGGGIGTYQASPTIMACHFHDNDGGAWGGGAIMNYVDSHAHISLCTFQGNTALFGGAVLAAYSSSPVLTGCTFIGNSAPLDGGAAVYCLVESNPVMTGCRFDSNTAQYGAAMVAHTGSSPTVTSCEFTGNAAGSGGSAGACYFYFDSNPTFSDCTFTGNTGDYSGALEGFDHCAPQFKGCTFRSNSAAAGGGVMSFYGMCNPTFDGCTFGLNSADYGGVLVTDDSSPTFLSCLFTGNTSEFAGVGAFYNGSAAEMINCTITGNTSGFFAGFYAYLASPAFRNSILWANSDANGSGQDSQLYYDGGTPSLLDCTVQGWTGSLGGSGNNGADPLFVDADGVDAMYGTIDDNPRLQPGSPCIDTGDNAALPGGVLSDLDGGPRILGDRVDRGAYEFVPAIPGDLDGDGDVDDADLLLFEQCATGPALGPPSADCAAADLDGDHDVDAADFGILQRCITGTNLPGNPGC